MAPAFGLADDAEQDAAQLASGPLAVTFFSSQVDCSCRIAEVAAEALAGARG